jgi:tetrahydromethanopterin S-methyltransferase subunit D
VLRVDRFAQTLFELLLLAAAVAALLALGVFWLWPVLLGIGGAVVGYLALARAR